jgi:hypothetical protein
VDVGWKWKKIEQIKKYDGYNVQITTLFRL